jgi:hypothetical protein
MKFLTVSIYDAEYLVINEMANCHKEKVGESNHIANIFEIQKLSSISVYPSPLLIIVQSELITFDKEPPLG